MKILTKEGNKYQFPPKYTDGPRPPLRFYDRPMGTGKTYDLINGFDPDTQYLVVHEFLEQVEDVINNPSNVPFYQPERTSNQNKSEHLSQLIRSGVNVVCTHELFPKIVDLVRQGFVDNYVIIIDETLNTLKPVNGPDKATWEALVDSGYAEVGEGGKIKPLPLWYKRQEDLNKSLVPKLRVAAEAGVLYVTKTRHLFVIPIPIEILKAGNSVTVMTFQAEGSVLAAYLDRFKVPYIIDRNTAYENKLKADIRELVTLRDIPALKGLSFSFSAQTQKEGHFTFVRKVPQSLKNLRSRKFSKVELKDIMVGCAKQNWFARSGRHDFNQSKPSDFSKCSTIFNANWVPPGIRGLNEYEQCSHVICLYDYHLSPATLEWLDRENDRKFKEKYALIELLQFIFRSRVRHRTRRHHDTDIELFLPSSRMRRIFLDWVNEGVNPEDQLKVTR